MLDETHQHRLSNNNIPHQNRSQPRVRSADYLPIRLDVKVRRMAFPKQQARPRYAQVNVLPYLEAIDRSVYLRSLTFLNFNPHD